MLLNFRLKSADLASKLSKLIKEVPRRVSRAINFCEWVRKHIWEATLRNIIQLLSEILEGGGFRRGIIFVFTPHFVIDDSPALNIIRIADRQFGRKGLVGRISQWANAGT